MECRGKKEIATSKDVRDLVDQLVELNWVRIAPAEAVGRPGRPESPTLHLHPSLNSHTRTTRNSPNEVAEGISGVSSTPIPEDLGLRGRIEEVAADE